MSGEFSGWGFDNVKSLLQGEKGYIKPPWRVIKEEEIAWKIRNHDNHSEQITSLFALANR